MRAGRPRSFEAELSGRWRIVALDRVHPARMVSSGSDRFRAMRAGRPRSFEAGLSGRWGIVALDRGHPARTLSSGTD